MGWNNQNVTSLLLITASGGFSGLFVYSPAPGFGNLIASIAAASGTDPYGNTYQAGVVSYGIGVALAQLLAGKLVLEDSTSSSWQLAPSNISGVPYMILTMLTTSNNLFVTQFGNIVAQTPGTHNPESLHSITSGFPAGWTGAVYYEALGERDLVFASWRLTIAAGTVVPAGAVILGSGSIPPGYRGVQFHNGAGTNFDATAGFGPAAVVSIGNDGTFNYSGPGFTAGATGNRLEGSMIYDVSI